MMHQGAARIALLTYVLGGLLLPMTHQHAAPVGISAAGGGHPAHGDGHCHGASGCGAAEADGQPPGIVGSSQNVLSAMVANAATDPPRGHHCHGFCVLCLAAGQVVTLARQTTWEPGLVPQSVGQLPDWVPPHAVRLPRANLLRGPPAFLS